MDRFGITIPVALSGLTDFDWESLPPFYCALFKAWISLGGTWSATEGYCFGSSSLGGPFPISEATCKSCYVALVRANAVQPHCVAKFGLLYGPLDWGSVLSSLFPMPLDRKVSDLAWKIAHEVLYTAERLCGFGYGVTSLCFCGFPLESLEHLFFFCPLAQSGLAWIQSLLYIVAPRAPSIDVKHVLFGFSRDDLRTVPFVFVYLIGACKLGIWWQRNDFRFRGVHPSAARLLAFMRSRVRFSLPLLFKRFTSAERGRFLQHPWGGKRVTGKTINGTFHFNLTF